MSRLNGTKRLDADMPAAEAIGAILATRFAEMGVQRDEALSSHAATGRRDLRTAARHLSYCFDFFTPFIDSVQLSEVQQSIEDLISALGDVIDEETFFKALVKVQPEAPAEFLRGIELLIEERRAHLSELRDTLSSKLTPQYFAELQTKFAASLQSAFGTCRCSGVNLRQIGQAIVWSALQEMQTASTALYRPSKTRTSHRLRISVRKLRYALDLFAPYVGQDLDSFAAELAPLQARLGKLRNCDLKLNALGDWLTEHHASVAHNGEMTAQWHAALWLLGHTFERRPKLYRKALKSGQELLANGFAIRVAEAVSESSMSARDAIDIPAVPSETHVDELRR